MRKTVLLSIGQVCKEYLKLLIPPLLLKLYQMIRKPQSSGPSSHYEFCGLSYQLPKRNLFELFPGIERIFVTIPSSHIFRERGMLPLTELLVLAGICKYLKPRRIFEIGTYKGSSTLVMAMHTPDDTEIFTLDLNPTQRETTKYQLDIGDITGLQFTVGELYRGTEFEGKIRQLYGDSACFNFEAFYDSVDLLFIDGNHAYENVKSDSDNAFRMLRGGGVIIWDDYHLEWGPGVVKHLNELNKSKTLYQILGTRFAIYKNEK